MKLNTRRDPIYTREGAKAHHINPEQQLRRSLMACLLWEQAFYEDGVEIAGRIAQLVPQVHPDKVKAMAIEAREQMKLRHAPLLVARELARIGQLRSGTLAHIIQRADELTEFLAIYWKDGKQPLSKQVKLGLAEAFPKFDAYQLAKYNRDGEIKLRDVLFLCHAKPKDKEQAVVWKKLVDGQLEPPDTWEVNLSAGVDKKETFTRLMTEGKLGALALLRNLRNMQEAGVGDRTIRKALQGMDTRRVLPFRFIAAARYAPNLEDALEDALFRCTEELPKLGGRSIVLVDVSGSMDARLTDKSDMNRIDAACGVAMVAREMAESVRVFTFSAHLKEVPPRRGFALRDAVAGSQPHMSTYLGAAVGWINENVDHDRLIVVTDEQSHDVVPSPKEKGYMLNVAPYHNGVGYGAWTHIDGFSEAVLNYIRESEDANL